MPERHAAQPCLAAALAAALGLAGCFGPSGSVAGGDAGGNGGSGGGSAAGGSAGGTGAGAADPPPADRAQRPVRVVKAQNGRLARTVTVAGTLAADQQAELGMKVTGRLELMAVDLGTAVRRGQTIARLVQTDLELRVAQSRSALEQARALLGLNPGGTDTVADLEQTSVVRQADAQLRQARLAHERARTLFAQQLLSQSDLDAAEAAFLVAEARRQDAVQEARNRQALLAQRETELSIARQQLTDSTLTAPFDGMIRERRAVAGDYVAIGQSLVLLVRVDPLRLRLAVPEREAPGLSIGQSVKLAVEGDPRLYAGRLVRMSPAISEDNRTLLVEAEVPNRDGRLRPGSFARAEIITRAEETAVLVPASAVVTFAGIDKVIAVQNGRAQEVPVRTGRRSGDRVEILEGLAAGTPVVTAPGNLVSGEPVRVVP
ncbi:MAG TPA: efflux RND transporter periplasmic adaptor subunit [Thermoanaerobaculia bacterium]|nr:efflux RND transporter periplasmic adaptor subunit [Thermoanaerobaculia bacterium]